MQAKNYELTSHAEEEREEDDLAIADLEEVMLRGKLARCGERYYDAVTLEKMEAIVCLKTSAKRKVVVPVRDFAEAVA